MLEICGSANDTEITEQYISVGVGRDYADVSPLKGIYTGQGATGLGREPISPSWKRTRNAR